MLSVEPGDEIERAQVRRYHAPTIAVGLSRPTLASQRDGAFQESGRCYAISSRSASVLRYPLGLQLTGR
jgi:hypothetical protein